MKVKNNCIASLSLLSWICNTSFYSSKWQKALCTMKKKIDRKTTLPEKTCWSADSAQVKSLVIGISSNSICRNQREGWCDSSFENICQCHLIPLIISFLFKYFLQPVHLEDLLFCSKLFLFYKILAIFTRLSIVIKIDNTLAGSHRLSHWVKT